MGDFGCLNLPTSPDPFLDALEYDPADARRLLVAPFFVLEGLTRELPVAVFLLFPVTIVVRGYFLLPFLVIEGDLLQMLSRQSRGLAAFGVK